MIVTFCVFALLMVLVIWREIAVLKFNLRAAAKTIVWQQDQIRGYQGELAAEILRRATYVCPTCNTLAALPAEFLEEPLRDAG